MNHDLDVERIHDEENGILNGRRIVDLKYVLNWSLKLQKIHSRKCTSGQLELSEEKHIGLMSKIVFKCDLCSEVVEKYTEEPDKINNINSAMTWGTLSTGTSYSRIKEFLAVLQVPCLNYKMFHKIEMDLSTKWTEELWKSIKEAGKEELQHALDNGSVDSDGTPFCTVIADAGWCHRSYGHGYNADSAAVSTLYILYYILYNHNLYTGNNYWKSFEKNSFFWSKKQILCDLRSCF